MLEILSQAWAKLTGQQQYNFSNLQVLVVDDSAVDRKIVEKTISRLGCRVITANHGGEGLEQIRLQKPDLIVLDCDMPVISGWEMCQTVRSDEKTKDIPVLFLTSNTTPKNILECFELDAENFLSKPVNSQILSNNVLTILKSITTNSSIN